MLEKYLTNRLFVLYIIPFVLGTLTVFSFQPFNLSIINFLIIPTFFYFIIFIKKKSKNKYRKRPFKKNFFIFGILFGFGFFLSNIFWITNSLTFDENFKILIPFALILIPLFLSLFFGAVTFFVGPYLNFNLSSVLLFSGSLAFSDFVRAKILSGFPWNLWAYSFSWTTEILQILNDIGLFAFNLLIITLFLYPVVIIFNTSFRRKLIHFTNLLFIFLILFIYGNYSINENKLNLKNIEKKFNVKVVSPGFDLNYNESIEKIELKLNQLIKYSDPNQKIQTLFIWPEGVFSGYEYNEIIKFKKLIEDNFHKNHLIIFGVNTLDEKKLGYYNSLLLVNNKLEVLGRYNKQKLVPFGEFLPFEIYLKNLGLKKITQGYGSFLKGNKQKNIVYGNLNILPLICYEVIFTKLSQTSSYETNLIVNISEDAWFGDTIGPHQHFVKSIFRAIEQNTFLIRSANKGISAIINNKGEVIKKLDKNEKGNIESAIVLNSSNNKNKNDLIFLILLITYVLIFYLNKKKNER